METSPGMCQPRPSLLQALNYWRLVLLDGAQMGLQFGEEAVQVSVEEIRDGKLSEAHYDTLSNNPNPSDAGAFTILVSLGTFIERTRDNNGESKRHNVMGVLADVNEERNLSLHIHSTPWLNRNLLEPCESGATIGTVADMDAWLEKNPFANGTWASTIAWADSLLAAVSSKAYPTGMTLSKNLLARRVADGQGSSLFIASQKKFYDKAVVNDDISASSPLLKRYVHGCNTPQVIDTAVRNTGALATRGAMNANYGLSVSQSDAMAAYIQIGKGDILAVNGPPGTGKTTLLQSIIASEMVQRAITGEEPPVIVATAHTHTAITNIIKAMTNVLEASADVSWKQRWVEGAPSLGLYFCSGEKANKATKNGYLVAEAGDSLARDNWKGLPKIERVSATGDGKWVDRQAEGRWLEGFQSAFPGNADDLPSALTVIQSKMADLQAQATCLATAANSLRSGAIVDWQSALVKTGDQKKWISEFAVEEQHLPWMQEGVTAADIDDFLDRTVRCKLFHLAMRYWEGRWVEEVTDMHALGPNKYPVKIGYPALSKMYRRWAMLTPCFIMTTSSFPKYFIYSQCMGGEWQTPYMIDYVDLLIIDEAGQVSPHMAAAPMALSKKAVVVGDVFQVSPVVTSLHATDCGNARETGVYNSWWVNEEAADPRIVTAADRDSMPGSVMGVAQTCTSFTSNESAVPGVFLSEHRRCRSDIIAICNDLVYGGKLVPCRPEPSPTPPLAALGWANVNGENLQVDRSNRNIKEADAIARWIAMHGKEWCDFYQKPLSEIVAVVTPFKPQSGAIRSAVNRQKIENDERLDFEKVTVGTVYALQGQERPIILFSPAYDSRSYPGYIEKDRSLLNVAISRAQDSFVILGTMALFEGQPDTTLGIVGKSLFTKGVNYRDVTGNWAASDEAVLHGDRISQHDVHTKVFYDALNNLEKGEEVIIVSPFLSKGGIPDKVLRAIASAVDRGGVVSIVTRPAYMAGRGGGDEVVVTAAVNANQQLQNGLTGVGAKLLFIEKLHSKTLITPRAIIEGSFNWLSVRKDNAEGANLDTSWCLTGPQAMDAAKAAKSELRAALSDLGHWAEEQVAVDTSQSVLDKQSPEPKVIVDAIAIPEVTSDTDIVKPRPKRKMFFRRPRKL